MKHFEEIYTLKTLDVLKRNINDELGLIWTDLIKTYSRVLGIDPSEHLISTPHLSDNNFFAWSLEDRPIETEWAIIVGCDLKKEDALEDSHYLGTYIIDIGIMYINEYKEGLGYAAVSRVRKAITQIMEKHGELIAYNGGDLVVNNFEQMGLNPKANNRTIVSNVTYEITSG